MIFRQIPVGGDRNFAYLIADGATRIAALVDPAYTTDRCIGIAEEEGLSIQYLINTHGHHDHVAGNGIVISRTGARLVSASPAADIRVSDGDTLALGGIELRFLATPGHTEDSICVLAEGKLLTGDTLFVGKVGGTDLGEGARNEFESLKRLMELPDDTEVYPGHDFGEWPVSTIGRERLTNPFVQRLNDFEAFVDLKKNWADQKRKHGTR